MHYLLSYDLAADYLERRGEWRDEHLALAWAAQERGELLLAGALSDPADGALLVFQGDSSDAAQRFAKADPYVTHGLVTAYRVRQWNTVVGDAASTPVRPA
ncbi:YciI-like protein [Massilia sp. TSP1-1-2]|uniref:YciI-like protein n=1 Tax=unclassified Massilia TaxID=2609279 RepID=UPI003CEE3507